MKKNEIEELLQPFIDALEIGQKAIGIITELYIDAELALFTLQKRDQNPAIKRAAEKRLECFREATTLIQTSAAILEKGTTNHASH